MTIDKNTILFGSFSSNPGNNGCIFFNSLFEENNINAIYKSFYSEDIEKSYNSAKNLGFGGFAVSMPFKFEIVKIVDELDSSAEIIGAANTVVFKDNKSIAYNTDWIAVKRYLEELNINFLTIAGNGGFSKAVQHACNLLKINFELITRDNWNELSRVNNQIFNATPAEIIGKNVIDGRPHTETGKLIAELQANEQYLIYSQVFSDA